MRSPQFVWSPDHTLLRKPRMAVLVKYFKAYLTKYGKFRHTRTSSEKQKKYRLLIPFLFSLFKE